MAAVTAKRPEAEMSHKDYGEIMNDIREKYGPQLQEEYFRRMGVKCGEPDGSGRVSVADPARNRRERSDRRHSGGAQRPRNDGAHRESGGAAGCRVDS